MESQGSDPGRRDRQGRIRRGAGRHCQRHSDGQLEYRAGSVWGNPYLRVLRSQLEHYLAEERGEHYVHRVKNQTEVRKVKKARAALKKPLAGLQKRQQELEASLGT